MLGNVKTFVRKIMRRLAHVLQYMSGGRVSPDGVTIFGFLMHIPIAYLIAVGHTLWAAALLLVFGLFDTLDGELARLSGRESARGMLLDSVTDRMKEVLVYTGMAYGIIATTGRPYLAVWAVVACGASLLTSYVNAWGDAIMAKLPKQVETHKANSVFRGGLFPFEVRMAVVFVGLLSNRLALAVIVIAIGAAYTAFSRLMRVMAKVGDA